jgi:hypothetical protein
LMVRMEGSLSSSGKSRSSHARMASRRLLVVGLVAVTISQIEYSSTRAERDRAVRNAAEAKQVVVALRRDKAILARERDSARRNAGATAHALETATTDLRRWRRIAADRDKRRADRVRKHR